MQSGKLKTELTCCSLFLSVLCSWEDFISENSENLENLPL